MHCRSPAVRNTLAQVPATHYRFRGKRRNAARLTDRSNFAPWLSPIECHCLGCHCRHPAMFEPLDAPASDLEVRVRKRHRWGQQEIDSRGPRRRAALSTFWANSGTTFWAANMLFGSWRETKWFWMIAGSVEKMSAASILPFFSALTMTVPPASVTVKLPKVTPYPLLSAGTPSARVRNWAGAPSVS